MKRIWNRHTGMAALCCSLGLVMTQLSSAQQPAAPQVQEQRQELREQRQELRQARQEATQQQGQKQFCLASKVIGMHVKAKGDEKVGEIRNLIINREGQVQYLAVSAAADAGATTPRTGIQQPDSAAPGATTAATGKLTLVPWSLVKLNEGATPTQSFVAIDIEKDRLMTAPSFTEQQLTAEAGQMQLAAQVDQFFNVRTQRGAARPELDRDRSQQDQPRGTTPRSDNTPRSDETPGADND